MSEAVLQKNTHMERKESYDSMQNFDTRILEAIKWKSAEAFKNSLELKSDETRELEQKTREQRNFPEWFAARQFQITVSIFGDIIHTRQETVPDNLVKLILEQKSS